MKDRYHKKANVLGIDVSVMRVDKAVNVSMELMRGKGLPVIYFLSAISSLLCQNNEQSACLLYTSYPAWEQSHSIFPAPLLLRKVSRWRN